MGGVLFDDAGGCYLGAGVFAVWFIGGDRWVRFAYPPYTALTITLL